MNNYFLAFFLIFGLGHPKQDPVDPAKSAQLHSRLPCDGYGAPEDLLRIKATYSPGGSAREFIVSRYQIDKCSVETMFQCWHKQRAGWREVWAAENAESSAQAMLPLASCNEWGSTEAAQYILSGWYQEGAADPKLPWHQGTVKQVSSVPEVYEFSDPSGGTARLEITR
ncbi:MAG TPA: hypothetical protein VK708_13905 [Bryobacteraceae bacterium]|jgi:hypothetical protein|nr:hypothetical protein [Bryobacteraceae bacterium]